LDSLCCMFRGNGCGCCQPSCCCEQSCGCGCGDGCGNGCGCNGHSNGATDVAPADEPAPAAPAEAGASLRAVPPRPMADPNASIGHSRNVVRTSFVR
jgi:hypothetical protein